MMYSSEIMINWRAELHSRGSLQIHDYCLPHIAVMYIDDKINNVQVNIQH